MSIFGKFPVNRPKRNVLNLSHEKKLSCNFGKLIPIFISDLVPGDKFKNHSEIFIRFAPMLAPVMHRINVYTHFFFVPNRLIMPEKRWENFITGKDSTVTLPRMKILDLIDEGDLSNNNLIPFLGNGSLTDYLGIPSNYMDDYSLAPIDKTHLLPFLAYQLIYNEYYRDQNLQEEVRLDYWSDDYDWKLKRELLTLRNRAWEKDYFTSALPWPQRGEDVMIPGTSVMSVLK